MVQTHKRMGVSNSFGQMVPDKTPIEKDFEDYTEEYEGLSGPDAQYPIKRDKPKFTEQKSTVQVR
jgi:hypothetical protein